MIAAQFTKYEKNHNLYDQDKTAHPTDELHRFIDINNTGHQHNTVCGKGSDDAAKYCRNKINEQHLLRNKCLNLFSLHSQFPQVIIYFRILPYCADQFQSHYHYSGHKGKNRDKQHKHKVGRKGFKLCRRAA